MAMPPPSSANGIGSGIGVTDPEAKPIGVKIRSAKHWPDWQVKLEDGTGTFTVPMLTGSKKSVVGVT